MSWALSWVAGLRRALGFYGAGEPAGFILAVGGAVIVLFVYRMIAQRTA